MSPDPVVIHCSVGIERTGTLAFLGILKHNYTQNIPWPANLMETVADIRLSRSQAIQMEQPVKKKKKVNKKTSTRNGREKIGNKKKGRKAEKKMEKEEENIAEKMVEEKKEDSPLIEKFLIRVLLREKPVKTLMRKFLGSRKKTDTTGTDASAANVSRNRYEDISCLENNGVYLSGNQPYIHGNYVGPISHPKKFICTQGPLDSTIQDFWKMVIQAPIQRQAVAIFRNDAF